MIVAIHQLTAAIYLVAALVGSLGLALPAPRLGRVALGILALATLTHALCFGVLHKKGTQKITMRVKLVTAMSTAGRSDKTVSRIAISTAVPMRSSPSTLGHELVLR